MNPMKAATTRELRRRMALTCRPLAFVIIWALTGQGFFWPVYPLVGWAVGLSFQHFSAVLRGQITDEDVRHKLRPGAADESRRVAGTS